MTAVSQELVSAIRGARDAHPFTLYDTMFVGLNANLADPGWYANFQEMAIQDRLLFFQGRKANSLSWTNQPGERRDWQFQAQQLSMEMFAIYPAMGDFVSQPLDSTLFPALWAQIAQSMSIQITMGDAADIVWQSPLSFVPTSSAPSGTAYNAAAAPSTVLGNSGVPIKKNNVLAFPGSGLDIPAKSKIEVSLQIGAQVKQFLANANLPTPGYITVPVGGGVTVQQPQWYGLRLEFYGIRRVQLRGARESS
jgi:hypothetical protein